MWQCKHCKERYIDEPVNHLCMTDELTRFFKGRRALLEPLFRTFLQKMQRLPKVTVKAHDAFIILQAGRPFAAVRVTDSELEIFIKLESSVPLPPTIHPAVKLKEIEATHYFVIKSVADLTGDVLSTIAAAYFSQHQPATK